MFSLSLVHITLEVYEIYTNGRGHFSFSRNSMIFDLITEFKILIAFCRSSSGVANNRWLNKTVLRTKPDVGMYIHTYKYWLFGSLKDK